MWTFSRLGFSSAVQHRDKPDILIIRFRSQYDAHRHLQFIRDEASLAAWFESTGTELPKVEPSPTADYAFRFSLPAALWAEVMARLAATIDYDNFKDMMHTEAPHWNGVLMRIWSDTRYEQELERRPAARKNGEVWEANGTLRTFWAGRTSALKVGDKLRRAGRQLEFRGLQSLMGGGNEAVFRDVLLCQDVSITLPAGPHAIANALRHAQASSRASAESRLP